MAVSVHTQTFNVIYIYNIPDDAHKGALKIGKASVDSITVDSLVDDCESLRTASIERIKAETVTAGTHFNLDWAEVAFYTKEGLGHDFWDKDVHKVLLNSGISRHYFPELETQPDEWFDVDLDTAKAAIKAVKEGRQSLDLATSVEPKIEIVFRDEQKAAIEQTLDHFKKGDKMLWDAKMRFGKTLCALELIRRMEKHQRTLILTHRPTVRSGWFDDFKLIDFENFKYGSKPNNNDRGGDARINIGESFEYLEEHAKNEGLNFIYFASMQDLRGSFEGQGDRFKKNKDVFGTKWDLVIVDEAHEGTQTTLGKKVLEKIQSKHPKMLYLSGTPYNILKQFETEEIYRWDYNMEQDAKAKWYEQHPEERNPYEGLAKLNILTYNLGTAFENYTHTEDDYFNFREFFRTYGEVEGEEIPEGAKQGGFIHEDDVRKFLDLLCKEDAESNYPFANETYRKCFRHTFWVVPGTKAAAALQSMLNVHPFFGKDTTTGKYKYEVVNVAGEGSPAFEEEEDIESQEAASAKEKKNQDALRKVKNAIAEHERTITLSCGRLTTGVSVEQWTGVFMLAGSYNTKAATYMQTIFRSQTPYKKTPGIKTNCYAFDFAPDRTLTVIDEYLREGQKGSGGNDPGGEPKHRVENFLKWCSVISFDGSKTIDFDAKTFITKVNQAYSDHVIRKGFKDRKLYKPMDELTEAEMTILEQIGDIMKASGKSKGSGKTTVTESGVTGEGGGRGGTGGGRATPSVGTGGRSTTRTPEQERRDKSLSILNQISIRLPMMIFGEVEKIEGLSFSKFIADIDKESWEEFMPKGLTKKLFEKIQHIYNNDVFVSSAETILSETKAADKLPVSERAVEIARILANFHYPDKETVLTPWWLANKHMKDTIGGYDFFDSSDKKGCEPYLIKTDNVTDNIFGSSDTRVLEINSKSGVYPLYLAYTAYRYQLDAAKNSLFGDSILVDGSDIWKRVVEQNIFVVCQTPMSAKITRRVLAGYKDIKVNAKYYANISDTFKDGEKRKTLCKKVKDGKNYWKANVDNNMKFSAIVGNPPYQIMDNGAGASAKSVYHYFVNIAKELDPDYISMIMPARWYTAGKDTKDIEAFRTAMLNDKHISVLHDYIHSADCFENVDIKGGVCYFLLDKNHNGDCLISTHMSDGTVVAKERPLMEPWAESFIRNHELISILQKVKSKAEPSIVSIISSRDPFGYDIRQEGSQKTVPHKYVKEKTSTDDVEFYYNGWRTEGVGYVPLSSVREHTDWVEKYKVLLANSWGSGDASKDRANPFKVLPHSVCTETYLVIGPFETELEADNAISYINTKFFHALVSIMKISQHATRKVYSNVPMQDFSKPWSDADLYKKYGLTDKEKAFVDKLIKNK